MSALQQTLFVFVFILPVRIFFLIFWVCVYTAMCLIGTRNVKDLSEPMSEKSRWWISKFLTMFDFIVNHHLCDIVNTCIGVHMVKIKGDVSVRFLSLSLMIDD